MNQKQKKFFSIFFKAGILLLAFGFIYYKLSDNQNITRFKTLTLQLDTAKVSLVLGIVFLLMFLNWFLESLKWKFLVQRIEKISTWKAVESVFCGLTWAIFTPNRIGEYGGRVFFLSPRRRIMGVIAMGVGAFSQMVITNILGSLAILWFIGRFVELNILLYYSLSFLVVIFCGSFLLFYFNIRWLDGLLSRISFIKPYQRFFGILARYKKRELLQVFIYSFSRFAVFTTQYFLIIHLLIPEIQLFEMLMMIFILFFVQSALPSLDLLDVGVRSMTATYFFAFITSHEIAIMAATAFIWLINLIIPAILGSVFVLKLNFFGTNRN
ncbi:lysylphosphatidylglycerol synthase transmembrane domain-containing protein [Daejeonella oryzae]|uniref:lysylphosphatidylglycerol synthase domain-containing protein n=1 Tax=Daejeonella oryzae TaxID=1122943 RepID=UPI0003FFA695|nr:lysylphosphatidylglycerol synthase domain-containing protein [Daejeonella oryzae]